VARRHLRRPPPARLRAPSLQLPGPGVSVGAIWPVREAPGQSVLALRTLSGNIPLHCVHQM
jgi:hypothetical protein